MKRIKGSEFLTLKKIGEHEWEFEYSRLDMEAHEELGSAIDLWEAGDDVEAMKIYKKLVKNFPEFIDAHHHLAMLYEDRGEVFRAFEIWERIVGFALIRLPADFYFGPDRLPWSLIDNRPFLRAYHALGLFYLKAGQVEKAFSIFTNILDLNPNDNQGIRELAVNCSFRLRRPGDVLRICDRFEGDIMGALLYGRGLALFQLGHASEAEQALEIAIQTFSLIAKELIKTKSRIPPNTNRGRVTLGGADQAYYYRQEFFRYWTNTRGALDLVKRCLEKYERH